jgi:hypothetical protein
MREVMKLHRLVLRTVIATVAAGALALAASAPASAAPALAGDTSTDAISEYSASLRDQEKIYDAYTPDGMVGIQSGFATSPVASFTWSFRGVNIKVPAGCFLNMSVQGSGLKLDRTIAGVECVGPAAIVPGLFCNWSGKYRFLDARGKQYATETTKVRSGCGQASFNIPSAKSRTMKTGQICVDFLNNGTKRGTTCMAVFK